MKKSFAYRLNEKISINSLLEELRSTSGIGVEVMHDPQNTRDCYYSKILRLSPTGDIMLVKQQCFSSTCQCVNHPRWITQKIEVLDALELINDFLVFREKYGK